MLYDREPVSVVDFDSWFATDNTSKLYVIIKYYLNVEGNKPRRLTV